MGRTKSGAVEELEIPKGFWWVDLLYRTDEDMRTDKAAWVGAGWTVYEMEDLRVTYRYPDDEEPPIPAETGVSPVGSS